ncbi:serine hydrolase [Nocardioides jensenii]|uniref:serine hydrolase n=1 Tax=Nocardioides jensenii TaxID=1843 RepID=UPI000A5F62FA|nr:serine hydrolase [Nocardioides jensenii]
MITTSPAVEKDILKEAAAVGVRVWLQAQSVRSVTQVGVGPDIPVVLASLLKVPVALELARRAASGEFDLDRQVTLSPADLTPSPSGLGTLRGPVTLPVRDLAVLMLSLSDNAATDFLLSMVGRDAVERLLGELGLSRTAVPQDCAEIIRSVGEDLGLGYVDKENALAGIDSERLRTLRALDPDRTCRSTARETVSLLRAIWQNEAGPSAACANVREWLSHQAWDNRMASGFEDDVEIASKTGTLPGLRNEAGVVTYPDGGAYAVAVFTRDEDFRSRNSSRDHFIGRAARLAVEALRRAESDPPKRRTE